MKIELSTMERKKVLYVSNVSPGTLQRYLEGEPIRDHCRVRIDAALQEMGLLKKTRGKRSVK